MKRNLLTLAHLLLYTVQQNKERKRKNCDKSSFVEQISTDPEKNVANNAKSKSEMEQPMLVIPFNPLPSPPPHHYQHKIGGCKLENWNILRMAEGSKPLAPLLKRLGCQGGYIQFSNLYKSGSLTHGQHQSFQWPTPASITMKGCIAAPAQFCCENYCKKVCKCQELANCRLTG